MAQELLKIQFLKAFQKQYSSSVLRRAAEEVGKEMILIQRERTAAGLDIFGRRFGSYTAPYNKLKRQIVGGGGGKGKKTKVSRSAERIRSRRTEFAATNVKDYLRLTGELFSDMRYDVIQAGTFGSGTFVSVVIRNYIAARSARKAEGLMSITGRNRYVSYSKKAFIFFGLSKGAGAGPERERLLRAFGRGLGSAGRGLKLGNDKLSSV